MTAVSSSESLELIRLLTSRVQLVEAHLNHVESWLRQNCGYLTELSSESDGFGLRGGDGKNCKSFLSHLSGKLCSQGNSSGSPKFPRGSSITDDRVGKVRVVSMADILSDSELEDEDGAPNGNDKLTGSKRLDESELIPTPGVAEAIRRVNAVSNGLAVKRAGSESQIDGGRAKIPRLGSDSQSVRTAEKDSSSPTVTGNRNGDKKRHICQKCSVTFPTQGLLEIHRSKVHMRFLCKYCKKGFEQKVALHQHMMGKHGRKLEIISAISEVARDKKKGKQKKKREADLLPESDRTPSTSEQVISSTCSSRSAIAVTMETKERQEPNSTSCGSKDGANATGVENGKSGLFPNDGERKGFPVDHLTREPLGANKSGSDSIVVATSIIAPSPTIRQDPSHAGTGSKNTIKDVGRPTTGPLETSKVQATSKGQEAPTSVNGTKPLADSNGNFVTAKQLTQIHAALMDKYGPQLGSRSVNANSVSQPADSEQASVSQKPATECPKGPNPNTTSSTTGSGNATGNGPSAQQGSVKSTVSNLLGRGITSQVSGINASKTSQSFPTNGVIKPFLTLQFENSTRPRFDYHQSTAPGKMLYPYYGGQQGTSNSKSTIWNPRGQVNQGESYRPRGKPHANKMLLQGQTRHGNSNQGAYAGGHSRSSGTEFGSSSGKSTGNESYASSQPNPSNGQSSWSKFSGQVPRIPHQVRPFPLPDTWTGGRPSQNQGVTRFAAAVTYRPKVNLPGRPTFPKPSFSSSSNRYSSHDDSGYKKQGVPETEAPPGQMQHWITRSKPSTGTVLPFCPVCKKSFSHNTSLQEHMLSHKSS